MQKKTSLPIESNSLIFRPLAEGDVTDVYVAWLNDPKVNQYLETRHSLQTLSSCRNFVAEMNVSPTNYLQGIFLKSNGKHIGNAKIGFINDQHKNGQISLFIGDKDFWGQGLACETIKAMTEYAFNELGLLKLEAGCYEENLASLRAFLKSGYSVEGFMRSHVISKGLRKGCFWLGAVADEWHK